jgi:hypothetical protein
MLNTVLPWFCDISDADEKQSQLTAIGVTGASMRLIRSPIASHLSSSLAQHLSSTSTEKAADSLSKNEAYLKGKSNTRTSP